MTARDPIIYEGNRIGKKCEFGHFVLIRENNTIGNRVRIGSYTEIAHDCIIEDDVQIHSKCFIPEGTVLRKGCWIGPNVTFTNDLYPRTGGEFRAAATIGEGSIVGANSTIMPGVKVGKNSLIGAGSIVKHDIGNDEVWYGCNTTAKLMGKRSSLSGYPSL